MDQQATLSKTVLITGCSSGIGLCLAQGLKARGYQVIATARDPKDVASLSEQGLISYPLDLASEASVDQACDQVLANFNSIDALIHNGAYGQVGALEDISRSALDKQFQTNVFGWHQLTNRLLPAIRRAQKPRIIYLSSILGFVAMPFRGPYNASKFAIEGLVDTLRLELSDTKIQLSLIEPGPIESKFRENAYQAFLANVDASNSRYQANYDSMIARLQSKELADFTLSADAVLKCVVHALESRRAKLRYWVTFPTKLFGILSRLLPARWVDKLLYTAGGGGKR